MRRKNAGVSIFQRADGRFVLSFQIEVGRWKQHVLDAGDDRAAQREAHRWLAEQRAGGHISATKPIRDLWRSWVKLRAASPNLATSTVRDNESHFERIIEPKIGSIPIGELTHAHVRDFVRELVAKYSANTVRNIVSTLSAFYQDARAEGWVVADSNVVRHPAVDREVPGQEKNEPSYLLLSTIVELANHPSISEDRRVHYTLAFLSGLRPGEVHGLVWSDVLLDHEVPHLSVARAFALKASATAYAAITKTKTPGSVRKVSLHPAAIKALTWWRDHGWAFYVGREMRPSDPVFASPNGAHWRPKSAGWLRDDLERVGLPSTNSAGLPAQMKDSRSSFSTWLADAGVDDAETGRMLGHVGRSTSSKHYTAIVLGRMRDAIASIPFTWQDPPPLGGPSGSSGPHSAQLVRAHNDDSEALPQSAETASDSDKALVAQWIEQRFPNSTPGPVLAEYFEPSHNAAGVSGSAARSESAEVAGYEARASQFDGRRHVKLGRREAVRRQRDDEVKRLLLEAKRVVVGDTTLPTKEARREHVYGIFARVSELRGGR